MNDLRFTILRFDSLASTNDEAARQAKFGAAQGVAVVARQQTAGRGRRNRAWHSPPDAGLYFSVVLRPKFAMQSWSLITLAAAVAVYEAILESCDLKTDIKWANDIHSLGSKKISGMLAETVETPGGNAVVLGIGINLRKTAIAPELREIATSLEHETGFAPDAEKLLESLTANLGKYYRILSEPDGMEKIVNEWTRRSSYASNKSVCVTLEDTSFDGTTRGLDRSGALRVETETGTIKTVYAGDVVSLRPPNLKT